MKFCILNEREEHQEISTVNQNVYRCNKSNKTNSKIEKECRIIQNLFVLTFADTYIKKCKRVCIVYLYDICTNRGAQNEHKQTKKKNENENKNIENVKTKSEIPILSNSILMYVCFRCTVKRQLEIQI